MGWFYDRSLFGFARDGHENYEIAEHYGITDKELNEWKVWQGLTGKRGPVSKQDLACKELSIFDCPATENHLFKYMTK